MRVTAVVPFEGGQPVVSEIMIPLHERDLAMSFFGFAQERAKTIKEICSGESPLFPDDWNPVIAARALGAVGMCAAVMTRDMERDRGESLVIDGVFAEAVYPHLLLGMHEMAKEKASFMRIGRQRRHAKYLSRYLGLIQNNTVYASQS